MSVTLFDATPAGTKFWTPERLVELADMLCRMTRAEAARQLGRSDKSIAALCAHHGITPGKPWTPPVPAAVTRVRCLGPDADHWFESSDPRRERICPKCRELEVFRG